MANTDNPRGLEPVKHLNGNPYNGKGQVCFIGSSNSNDFFVGQPVDLSGSADSTGKYPEVQDITYNSNGNPIFGVIVGFDVAKQSSPLSYNYGYGGIDRYPIVATDPDLIFRVQSQSGTTPTNSMVGQGAQLNNDESGDTTYGSSGVEVNLSSLTQNSDDQVIVMGLDDSENNELAEHANILVVILHHRLRTGGKS